MGARCNRCGECCENISLNTTKVAMRAGLSHPDTLEKNRQSAEFILEHWHRAGGGGKKTIFSCDMFDTTTRLCTAHNDRPPVCSGYPWYGREPSVEPFISDNRTTCSMWFDLPKKDRPEWATPVRLRVK